MTTNCFFHHMVMPTPIYADAGSTEAALLPRWGTLALLAGVASAGFQSLARKPVTSNLTTP